MRILVTGGTGFLGPPVVEKLVAGGHTVRLISRSAGSSLRGVEHLRGDLRELDSVRAALQALSAPALAAYEAVQ